MTIGLNDLNAWSCLDEQQELVLLIYSRVQPERNALGRNRNMQWDTWKKPKTLTLRFANFCSAKFSTFFGLVHLINRENAASSRNCSYLHLPVTDTSLAVFFTECLWSNLETSFLKELVILYQRVSQENLSQFMIELMCVQRDPFTLHPHETVTLQILQILYQVRKCLDPD